VATRRRKDVLYSKKDGDSSVRSFLNDTSCTRPPWEELSPILRSIGPDRDHLSDAMCERISTACPPTMHIGDGVHQSRAW